MLIYSVDIHLSMIIPCNYSTYGPFITTVNTTAVTASQIVRGLMSSAFLTGLHM